MTADDWASCTDPEGMLTWLRDTGAVTERKARLFAVAVCRRIWPLLTGEGSRRAVEVTERWADGQADRQERLAAAIRNAIYGSAAVSVAWRTAAGSLGPRLGVE
jgi:hypothetical protein